MPIPEPKLEETKQDYISRGMRFFADESSDKPRDQQLAILYDKWKKTIGEKDMKEAALEGIRKYAKDNDLSKEAEELFVKEAEAVINYFDAFDKMAAEWEETKPKAFLAYMEKTADSYKPPFVDPKDFDPDEGIQVFPDWHPGDCIRHSGLHISCLESHTPGPG